MLRRSCVSMLARSTAILLQGWGSSDGGGWGSSDSAAAGGGGGGGGWGSGGGGASGGGWGSSDSGAAAPASGGGGWGGGGGGGASSGGGGWGNDGGAGGGGGGGFGGRSGGRRGRGNRDFNGGGGGGWGSRDSNGGGGGWGSGGGGGGDWGGGSSKPSWGGDAGWRDSSSSGGRGRGARGNFRRGRQEGGGGGMWGQPAAADEEAWNAAPPSFQPPVRRVDPLSLTAVEVDVDGVKKLVGQRVLVSGLSDETTWHTLKDHLRQAGDVGFCRIFSGGRGVVEFATPEEAARCITELQASELEGATLYLREDREDTVLINTRRKIREARDAQLRARKEAAERERAAKAMEQGDTPEPPLTPPA